MARPPKHPSQRRRRNAAHPFLELPAEGRSGKAPKWPLPAISVQDAAGHGSGPVHKLELELWRELWKLPQAVAWEALGYMREVAHYCRWAIKGELGDLDSAKEARMLSDRLGLTPKAAKSLGWVIVDADSISGTPKPPDVLNVVSIKDRVERRRRAAG